ncbi:MAG: hypothetical protein ACI8S6_000598 [Myxococcota bacterium]|jgi:hypothetical protein
MSSMKCVLLAVALPVSVCISGPCKYEEVESGTCHWSQDREGYHQGSLFSGVCLGARRAERLRALVVSRAPELW